MSAGELLNIIVILMLAAGGLAGWVLNRRLHRLRENQSELQSAIATFDSATRRAEATLARIESKGLARHAELEAGAARALILINELSVLTVAGERIADRIDEAVRDVRAIGKRRSAA